MLGASSRTPERPSHSVQSGPVGQREYTNAAEAADGTTCCATRSALRGNLD